MPTSRISPHLFARLGHHSQNRSQYLITYSYPVATECSPTFHVGQPQRDRLSSMGFSSWVLVALLVAGSTCARPQMAATVSPMEQVSLDFDASLNPVTPDLELDSPDLVGLHEQLEVVCVWVRR